MILTLLKTEMEQNCEDVEEANYQDRTAYYLDRRADYRIPLHDAT